MDNPGGYLMIEHILGKIGIDCPILEEEGWGGLFAHISIKNMI